MLKSSLISICKLYDKVADEVSLSKEGCRMVDKIEKNMLVFPRSNDKCYILEASRICEFSKFDQAIDETIVLFHKRLGHVNIKGSTQIIQERGC